ncbi:MAG: 50S ribosomal protein L10 [Bacteroidota bacterium]
MTKAEKYQVVERLVEQMKETPTFYIADTGGLTVEEVNSLRRDCHKSEIKMQVVKNTLIKKALEQLDENYEGAYEALKLHSAIFFTDAENPSVPAKLIKKFRKKHEKPVLKVACIDSAVFLGDDQLETLTTLKSKGELIGEVVTLLQSPAKNVVSALKSSGGKLAGILKTLSEREEA